MIVAKVVEAWVMTQLARPSALIEPLDFRGQLHFSEDASKVLHQTPQHLCNATPLRSLTFRLTFYSGYSANATSSTF